MEEEESMLSRREELRRELEVVDFENNPYKVLIKKMLSDVLNAKNATEDSYIDARKIEDARSIEDNEEKKSSLVSNLEAALVLLENTYKLGLITLKEDIMLAIKLAGCEEFNESKQDLEYALGLAEDHDDDDLDQLEVNYPCRRCGQSFERKKDLLKHRRVHHSHNKQCDQCEFMASGDISLENHKEKEHGTTTFSCPQCPSEFSSFNEFEKHAKEHGGFSYVCDLCEFETSISEYLRKHIVSIHGKMKYKCDDCEYTTGIIHNLKIHKDKVHESEEYSCGACNGEDHDDSKQQQQYEEDKKFVPKMTFNEFKAHLDTVHEINKFSCERCNFETLVFPGFKKHKLAVHGIRYFNFDACKTEKLDSDKNQDLELGMIPEELVKIEAKYDEETAALINIKEEDLLDKSLKVSKGKKRIRKLGSKDNIKRKRTKKYEENPGDLVGKDSGELGDEYLCNYCEFTARDEKVLTKHLRQDHNESSHLLEDTLISKQDLESIHACDQCSYRGKSFLCLAKHKYTIHQISQLPCDQCGHLFKKFAYLRQHFRTIHQGSGYTYCDQCSYRTTTVSNLKLHIEVQHQGKRFPCDECDYLSTCPYYLQRHKEKHLSKRIRFQCDQCEQTSATLEGLKKHKKVMHLGIKFFCDQCDYSVGNRTRFDEHKRNKHEGKIHRCEECEYVGSNANNLKLHIEGKHLGIRYPCEVCGQVFMRKNTRRNHQRKAHNMKFKLE